MERTSHSKCERFKKCPLMGYFGDIMFYGPDLVKPKDYSFAGSYTHVSIETWLIKYMNDSDINFATLVNPEAHFKMTMMEIFSEREHQITDTNDWDLITLCLKNFLEFMSMRLMYVKSIGMVNRFLPIFVEKEYNKVINGVPFHGFIDAIFQDVETIFIDWKTSKDTHISPEYKIQGTRYILLTEDEPNMKSDKFHVVNLRKRVDLKHAKIDVTEDMKAKQRQEIKELWDLMHGRNFPKRKKDCFFCDFKLRCKRYPEEGVILDCSNKEIILPPTPIPLFDNSPEIINLQKEIMSNLNKEATLEEKQKNMNLRLFIEDVTPKLEIPSNIMDDLTRPIPPKIEKIGSKKVKVKQNQIDDMSNWW
jgi:hypothetical protein